MKLLAILVLRAGSGDAEPEQLRAGYDLSDVNFFQKDATKQLCTFAAKTVAKRVAAGQRSSVEHASHHVHVHARESGLVLAAVCDEEYPSRVAYSLLMKVHSDFVAAYPNWTTAKAPIKASDDFQLHMSKYQNPAELDSIVKIQNDIDETKVIMHKTIESVLERGVKLDTLVEKSTDLSSQSKMFYKTSKKANARCCKMM